MTIAVDLGRKATKQTNRTVCIKSRDFIYRTNKEILQVAASIGGLDFKFLFLILHPNLIGFAPHWTV